MAELRFNPLLGDWTMVASNRQQRPDMPKDFCPFCPGSGKVPDAYEVHIYNNDFPVLSPDPPHPDDVATGLYKSVPAYGKCEVVLYSSNHTAALPSLSVSHIRRLVDVWTERFVELSRDPRHQYVFIFENRGPEVGVTMPHPHGQIYAYSYIPKKLQVELNQCEQHFQQTGRCLLCAIAEEEQSFQKRMLHESEHFVSFIPYFTDYPYGAFIVSKAHKTSLADFTTAERTDLALMLKVVTGGMDELFEREFPYMMAMHQRPVQGTQFESSYHFHIEFYPPLRAKDRIKYLASSETGAWAPANPTAVEDTAPRLRESIQRVWERVQRGEQ